MKVSEIIKARNFLKEILSNQTHEHFFKDYISNINLAFLNIGFLRDTFEFEVIEKAKAWDEATLSIKNLLAQGIDQCNSLISQQDPVLYNRTRGMYVTMMQYEHDSVILARDLGLDYKHYDTIATRLGSYSDWRYPAAVIRPSTDTLVERMVASDPLYLLDQRHSLLEPAKHKFPIEYQRRVRFYEINEGAQILVKLPDKQFNLIVVWNYLNYRPLDLLCQYLTEIYTKLRPGGVVAFTFNDCDYHSTTVLAEEGQASYTPGHLVLDCLQRLGFINIIQETNQQNFHYIEAEKPGTLTSIRGGQCLGKIMPKY